MSPTDPNFDWVTARFDCSAARAFQSIRLSVEADIKTRNQQLSSEGLPIVPFSIEIGPDVFLVQRSSLRRINRVRFDQIENGIKVTNEINGAVIIEGTLTLSNKGECRLKTAEGELEFWQFRRSALKSLFFESRT